MSLFRRQIFPFIFAVGLFSILMTSSCVNNVDTPPAVSGWYHRVKHGETLTSIARRYGYDPEVLRRLNSIPPGAVLREERLVFIPGGGARAQAGAARPAPTPVVMPSQKSPVRDAPRIASPAKSTPRASTSNSHAEIEQTPRPSIKPKLSQKSPPKTASNRGRFIMPVEGTIIRRFSKSEKTPSHGIDISAPEGTAVVASRSGKVIYSDNVIPGFGNMIIIDHDNGYTTLYGHNKQNLVKNNQYVRQGQKIATVGRSGKATGTYLHFEIRYNAEPVDPMKYLTN